MKKLAMLALAATMLSFPVAAAQTLTDNQLDGITAGADGVQPLSFLLANWANFAQAYNNPGTAYGGIKYSHTTANGAFYVFTRAGNTILFSPNAFQNAYNNALANGL